LSLSSMGPQAPLEMGSTNNLRSLLETPGVFWERW
jgi:hypothetical protein